MDSHAIHPSIAGDDEDERDSPPPIPRSLNKHKLQTFSRGVQKTSAFQRAKDEAEERKRREEEEAARVYEDFVASFDDSVASSSQPVKTFVRGETIVPTLTKTIPDTVASPSLTGDSLSSRLYQPHLHVQRPLSTTARSATAAKLDEAPVEEKPVPKRRKMNEYMATIKEKHDNYTGSLIDELKRDATWDRSVSNTMGETNSYLGGTGDPLDTSTNLYVGNLNPKLDEEAIGREFSRFGDIASIKVMWPRTPEEMARNRNSGFVSFMTRTAAVEAMRVMQGTDLHGYVMRIDWGKPVPMPARPLYAQPKELAIGNDYGRRPNAPTIGAISVRIPTDQKQRHIIHKTIQQVLETGPDFEIALIAKEQHSPTFAFLRETKSAEHHYYRWKLYSILKGESVSQWSTKTVQIFKDGLVYEPPQPSNDIPFLDQVDYDDMIPSSDDDLSEQRQQTGKGNLGDLARRRFETLLRTLTLDRAHIARAMAFAIDQVDAAEQIMHTLVKSLMAENTPAHIKLARLNLLSDIVYNSGAGVPNAWKYRPLAEPHLHAIFQHLNGVYRSIDARLKAEAVRVAVVMILKAWQTWLVFPSSVIHGLETIFLASTNAEPKILTTTSLLPMPAVSSIANTPHTTKSKSLSPHMKEKKKEKESPRVQKPSKQVTSILPAVPTPIVVTDPKADAKTETIIPDGDDFDIFA